MNDLKQLIDRMAPEDALDAISAVLKDLFSTVDEEIRHEFLWELMGESGSDKVASLVHL